eukprot:gene14183-10134_t
MDQNDLALRIGEKKEVFIKQKKPVNVQQLTKEVLYTSMTNYIQSRLAYTVAEEEPLFQISLQVLMGDTAVADANGEMRLDVLIPPPASLDPVATRFQKRISTKDINSALNSLKASAEELKRATRYAELSTSSVDGFKLMLAEKMKMEQEMKSRYSPARLLWIKAINRVLVQNYCDKVRARLEAKVDRPEAAEGLRVVTSFNGQSKKNIRILRKSIDNSDLNNSQKGTSGNTSSITLPAIHRTGSQADSPTAVNEVIEKTQSHDSSLPALTTPKNALTTRAAQRRRSRMNSGVGEGVLLGGLPATRLTRKSLNQDLLLQKYLPDITRPSPRSSFSLPTPSSTRTTAATTPTSVGSHSVPSLLQSYNAMSQKVIAPLPMSIIQGDYNPLSQKMVLSK